MRKKIFLLHVCACMFFSVGMTSTVVNADTPFIGEVRWFAGNFVPRNWELCNGQLLDIASNTALFSILGTTYGGDGRVTFALPDMRGRGMVHEGNGPGLTSRTLGARSGSETVTLTSKQLPSHSHGLNANSSGGDSVLPNDRVISKVGRLRIFDGAPDVIMGASSIAASGGRSSHYNMQPYITMNCIIAVQGVFPSRN